MTDIFPEGRQEFGIEYTRSRVAHVALGNTQIGRGFSYAAGFGLDGKMFLHACDELTVWKAVLLLFNMFFRFHNAYDDGPLQRRAQTGALLRGKKAPCLDLV